LAVEYLENTNFDKVTIATVSKYIVANMYDIKLEKHNKTVFQMVKAKRGSDEADKFLKHITEVFKLLLAYPQKYSKKEILAKLRSKIV
jgi:ribonuclease HI